jgi:hypothetical protein
MTFTIGLLWLACGLVNLTVGFFALTKADGKPPDGGMFFLMCWFTVLPGPITTVFGLLYFFLFWLATKMYKNC